MGGDCLRLSGDCLRLSGDCLRLSGLRGRRLGQRGLSGDGLSGKRLRGHAGRSHRDSRSHRDRLSSRGGRWPDCASGHGHRGSVGLAGRRLRSGLGRGRRGSRPVEITSCHGSSSGGPGGPLQRAAAGGAMSSWLGMSVGACAASPLPHSIYQAAPGRASIACAEEISAKRFGSTGQPPQRLLGGGTCGAARRPTRVRGPLPVYHPPSTLPDRPIESSISGEEPEQ